MITPSLHHARRFAFFRATSRVHWTRVPYERRQLWLRWLRRFTATAPGFLSRCDLPGHYIACMLAGPWLERRCGWFGLPDVETPRTCGPALRLGRQAESLVDPERGEAARALEIPQDPRARVEPARAVAQLVAAGLEVAAVAAMVWRAKLQLAAAGPDPRARVPRRRSSASFSPVSVR